MLDCTLLRVGLFTALFLHCLVQQGQRRNALGAPGALIIFAVTLREKKGQNQG